MEPTAVTASEEETEALGESLAADLAPGDVVYLLGELGAGKTCLARGLARGLGAASREVASPTFAILHEYAGADGAIRMRHLDLYRLKDRREDLEVLGLPESVSGAPIVVEWPGEAIRKVLPPTVEIRIDRLPDGVRRFAVSSPPARLRPNRAAGSC